MRLVPHLIALSLGAPLLACSSTPVDTTIITRPEIVQVSPEDFLGSQKCGDGPELVGSYVATLFDVTPASDGGLFVAGFPLPSSPPTSCEFPVTFSFVLPDHRYTATIDAFNRLPQALDGGNADPDSSHITAVSPGGRLQMDGTGARVPPRWTARCGGYPTTSDAGVPDASEAGTDAGDASLPGAVSYDTLTTSVHYCPGGLQPVQ
jgi:hypothetical protein